MNTNEALGSLPANAVNELVRAATEDSQHTYSFTGGYIAAMFEHDHLNERQLLDAMALLNSICQDGNTRDEVLAWGAAHA